MLVHTAKQAVVACCIQCTTSHQLFGVGISTVRTIVNNTCSVIAKNFLPRYVQMPTDGRLREVIDGFKSRWGFPQVVGAIDGSHIPIIRPSDSATDYYNRKCFHSIIIQEVVDYQGQLLTSTLVGRVNCMMQDRVFYNSSFYRKGCQGTLLPSQPVQLEGKNIRLLILGDPAYPLLPWLKKPHPYTATTTPQEKHFNYCQSQARMVVENAFGRLKGRWRCLLKRMDGDLKSAPAIVAACVTLHNICERFGDSCRKEWVENEDSNNKTHHAQQCTNSGSSHTATSTATDIRDALTTHLNKN